MDRPLNHSMPEHVPVSPSGSCIDLIARMVWPDRVELRPARTHRWTDTHVLVEWWPDGVHGRSPEIVWLRVEDVQRVIVVEGSTRRDP